MMPSYSSQRIMDVSIFWREKFSPDYVREHALAYKNIDPGQRWKPGDTFDDSELAQRALAKLLAYRTAPLAPSAAIDPARLTARFLLGERVGRDPLGRVFHAIDREQHGKAVTYRVIDPALTAVPATRRELEAQLAVACAHPHPGLVNVLASAPTAQGQIVVTEKIEGFTLIEVLKHRGALPPHEALLLLGPLAAAADHAALHDLHGFSLRPSQTWVHFGSDVPLEDRQKAPRFPPMPGRCMS